MIEKYDKIRQELAFYFENNKSVHITTNKVAWYNGKIIRINETSVFLNERMQGVKILFFDDIKSIEPFKEVKE